MSAGDVSKEQRLESHSHRLRVADSHRRLGEARNVSPLKTPEGMGLLTP